MLKAKDQVMPQTSDTPRPQQPVGDPNMDQEMTTDAQDREAGETTFQVSLPSSTAPPEMAQEGGSAISSTSVAGIKEPSKANDDKSTLEKDTWRPSADPAHGAGTTSEPPSHAMRTKGPNGLDAFGSLLPGLESYANAGAEDNNVAVQHPKDHVENDSKGRDQQPDTTDSQQGRPDMGMDDVLVPESNFDDMFVGIGDFGDSEGLLTNVDIGDLDDAWFA